VEKTDKPVIHQALDSNKIELLKVLLDLGANPDIVQADGKRQTLLRKVCGLARLSSYPSTIASRDKEEKRQSLLRTIIKAGVLAGCFCCCLLDV